MTGVTTSSMTGATTSSTTSSMTGVTTSSMTGATTPSTTSSMTGVTTSSMTGATTPSTTSSMTGVTTSSMTGATTPSTTSSMTGVTTSSMTGATTPSTTGPANNEVVVGGDEGALVTVSTGSTCGIVDEVLTGTSSSTVTISSTTTGGLAKGSACTTLISSSGTVSCPARPSDRSAMNAGATSNSATVPLTNRPELDKPADVRPMVMPYVNGAVGPVPVSATSLRRLALRSRRSLTACRQCGHSARCRSTSSRCVSVS